MFLLNLINWGLSIGMLVLAVISKLGTAMYIGSILIFYSGVITAATLLAYMMCEWA